MNDYLNDIVPFLQDLIEKTESGSIHWKRINPTTLYWIKEVSAGRVRSTIQRVEGPNRNYYRFEVKEIDRGEELIAIDTRESTDAQPVIEDLYNTAENYSYRNQSKRSEIFKELLES